MLNKLRLDLSWYHVKDDLCTPPGYGRVKLLLFALYCSVRYENFYAVFLFRLSSFFYQKKMKPLAVYFAYRLRRRFATTIAYTAQIDGGLILPHPYGIVIGSKVKIGIMTSIGQHVTLGANFEKMNSEGRKFPVVGDWSFICAGSVVAGPVTIGEDVIIGANTLVSKDIPDHAIVGGNPAAVKAFKEPFDEVKGRTFLYKQYFGFPAEYIENLRKEFVPNQ